MSMIDKICVLGVIWFAYFLGLYVGRQLSDCADDEMKGADDES